MHLYVVRHGETWANAEQRYLGSLNLALTELGRRQAEALGEYLPKNLDALVVSPRISGNRGSDHVFNYITKIVV